MNDEPSNQRSATTKVQGTNAVPTKCEGRLSGLCCRSPSVIRGPLRRVDGLSAKELSPCFSFYCVAQLKIGQLLHFLLSLQRVGRPLQNQKLRVHCLFQLELARNKPSLRHDTHSDTNCIFARAIGQRLSRTLEIVELSFGLRLQYLPFREVAKGHVFQPLLNLMSTWITATPR